MPLTMEDKFAITEQIYRFNFAMDARETDVCLACVLPHLTLVVPEGTFEYRGHDEYRAFLESFEDSVPRQHWVGNVLVEGDGDRATAKTYVLCPEGPHPDGSFGVFVMGTIDYSAVRVDGEWLFSQFSIKRDKIFEV